MKRYKIASGVMDAPSEENRVRRERAEQTGDMEILDRIKKVGALFRVNDEAATVVVDAEYASVRVEGEWSSSADRDGLKTREHREPFDDFDLEEYLDRRLEWSKVRREYKGKTGWEILK